MQCTIEVFWGTFIKIYTKKWSYCKKKSIKLKKRYYSLKWKKNKEVTKREFLKKKYGKITQENEKSSFKAMLVTRKQQNNEKMGKHYTKKF